MGSGRWINCTVPEEGSPRAGQPKEEDKYTWTPGKVAHAQQAELTSSSVPPSNYYADLDKEWPELGDNINGPPKPSRIGTSYASAAGTPAERQSINSTTPLPSFLPSHCLVPPTFEHKKQPRRRAKDRSLKSYDACPRRIKKEDPHASRPKREVLARHNSNVEPPRPPPRDPVAHCLKRVCPMLDPSDQPDFLRPTPSERRTFGKPTKLFPDVIPKHSKVRYDWSKARKSVTPKHDSRQSANASRQRRPGQVCRPGEP